MIDIVQELRDYEVVVEVHDPWADPEQAHDEYGLKLAAAPKAGAYDAVVVAVGHQAFREMGPQAVRAYGKPGAVLFDVKAVFSKDASDLRL